MAHCRALRFDEEPNYDHLRRLFKELFVRKGYTAQSLLLSNIEINTKYKQRMICNIMMPEEVILFKINGRNWKKHIYGKYISKTMLQANNDWNDVCYHMMQRCGLKNNVIVPNDVIGLILMYGSIEYQCIVTNTKYDGLYFYPTVSE